MKHKFTFIAVLLFLMGTVNVFSQQDEQKVDPRSMFNLSNVLEEAEITDRPAEPRAIINASVLTTDNYVAGDEVAVEFTLSFGSPDSEWVDGFEMTFPAPLVPTAASDIGDLDFTVIDGQTVEWGTIPGGSGFGDLRPGTYNFTVTLDVAAGISGDQVADWTIHGDEWGGPPNVVSGIVSIPDSPIEIECPPGAIAESEPCGEDLNGGCNMDPGEQTWEIVQPGDVICGTLWAEGDSRDTDWFEMTLTEFSNVVLHADAEAPMLVFHLSPTNCEDVAIVADMTAGPFQPNSLDLGVLPPGIYWFWTGLTVFDGWPCDVNYVIEFDVTAAAPEYCLAGPTTLLDSNVEQVSISGENDTEIDHTGCDPAVTGVEDLTHLSVDLIRGETYTLEVTFGSCGGNFSGAGSVWIDWDQNITFDPADLIHQSTGTPGTAPWDGPVEITFTVPATAELGNTVMRVMQREFGTLPLDPCGTFSWGSVMDFGINVLDPPPTARVQIIHNSAAVPVEVDIFANGELLLGGLDFRHATPFLDLPAEVVLELDIAPADEGIGASVFDTTVEFDADGTYIVVAAGDLIKDTSFNIFKFDEGREVANNSANTDVLAFHGSTDAGTVSIWETTIINDEVIEEDEIIGNFSFGDFAGYLELATENYILQVRDAAGENTVATYFAPLANLGLEGQALVVLASGFLNPPDKSDPLAFGLYVALSGGGPLIPLGDPPLIPISNWALYLGIILMISFVMIRFRRMI